MTSTHNAFELAVQQLPLSLLRKLCLLNQLNTSHCTTRDDFVDTLRSLNQKKRIEALKEFVLAGRLSMSIFQWDAANKTPKFKADFNGTATDTPSIVTVGKSGEINKDQIHVQWAVSAGQSAFLDPKLTLRVEPEAIVIDTFYDEASAVLQVRSNAALATRIARRWAEMNTVVYDTQVVRRGLSTVDEAEGFCDRLKGSVYKGTGDKLRGQGFRRVSGQRDQGVNDLRGTPDYKAFRDEVTMMETQIEFDHPSKHRNHLGIGLDSLSLVFVTAVDEEIIMYVYTALKKFLKIK
jgi:hypothetical protein